MNPRPLMTWGKPSHRDHYLAALGVIVGMLTITLLVVAMEVIL